MNESRRIAAVQPPIVPIVGRWIRETPGTISLGQGMVSYGPPPQALEAVRSFGADPNHHRYGAVEGEARLIEAFERKLAIENGIRTAPDSRIVVTAGSNMGFVNAVLAIADPGDEVVLPAPFYFNHEMAIAIAGCRPVVVPTRDDYQLDADVIRRALTSRTRAVVTVSPNNPTGAVYPAETLREVNALCASHGLFHIHDEAYEYFTYGDAVHFSPGAIPGAAAHTISLFSLSKAYGLAGWRVGFMVIPAGLFEAIDKIQDTNLICPPIVSQHAALGALGAGAAYCRERVGALKPVREHMYERLAEVSDLCDAPRTAGAFYCLLRLHVRADALRVAERLVREHRVAVIPGTAFGLAESCHLRVSFGALDAATVEEGVDRLAHGLRAIV